MDKKTLREKIEQSYKEALEFDSWNQASEAIDSYKRTYNILQNNLDASFLGPEDKQALQQIQAILVQRCSALKERNKQPCISVDDMNKLKTQLKQLFTGSFEIVGLNVTSESVQLISPVFLSKNNIESLPDVTDDIVVQTSNGSLLPPPRNFPPNSTLLTIKIDKIGLKDAPRYLDPFITVFVADADGNTIGPVQNTPASNRRQTTYIMYDSTVYIQVPINELAEGSAIFFEFKHYKPNKKKISTRCWTFMEMDEIKPGELAMELYKKPTDPRRKKVRLFSIKQLYLHVRLALVQE